MSDFERDRDSIVEGIDGLIKRIRKETIAEVQDSIVEALSALEEREGETGADALARAVACADDWTEAKF